LTNPGLELTGPWHPLDMAFNALNSAAPMNMPDFEDASPPHFQPDGTPTSQPVGVFAALQNAKEIFEGRWTDRPYEVMKKGKRRAYKINTSSAQWPIRFGRPPGIHVRYDHIRVEGRPVPALIPITVIWTLNNFESLKRAGSGVYYYIPKLQTPQEALLIEHLDLDGAGLDADHAFQPRQQLLHNDGPSASRGWQSRYVMITVFGFTRRGSDGQPEVT
jgi:malate synthase